MSLGVALCGLVIISAPFLIPPATELPGTAAEYLPPGCFVGCFIIILLPLSLLPAFAAWAIRERMVRPREAAERHWWESAPWREERLRAWTVYLSDLLLRHRALRGTPDDPVPSLLRAEIPRALNELDGGRSARLFLFLRETGLQDILQGIAPRAAAIREIGPAPARPRRGLVFLAAALFSLFSAFCILWAVLTAVTLTKANFFEAMGIYYSRTAQLVLGLSGSLIPAIVSGLAAAGLVRMYRKAERSYRESEEGSRAAIQNLALKSAVDQIEILTRWARMEGSAGDLALQIARAAALTATPELDGSHRGRLVLLLFESSQLTGPDGIQMAGVDLRGAELSGSKLQKIHLAGADLSGADLSGSDLHGADLRRCVLRGSDLRSCDLTGANLRGADLRYARVQKAVLAGTDLREVLLDDANFWGADLSGTELSGAQGKAEYLAPAAETT
jgi:uncharacterized protein YjbI with pentapeptide repeats